MSEVIEKELRIEALRLSIQIRSPGKSDEKTIETAKVFYAFLTPKS